MSSRSNALPPEALAAVAAAYAILRARATAPPEAAPRMSAWTVAHRLGGSPAYGTAAPAPGTLWRTKGRLAP